MNLSMVQTAIGILYEWGKGQSGKGDYAAFGGNFFSGALSAMESIAKYGSVDPMVCQNQEKMAKWAKNINRFNMAFGLFGVFNELNPAPTQGVQLESLTFRFVELSGQASLGILP
ncbi:hypothetical protein U3A58_10735 [Algoriphagus sp. C2-6-M1]|uniref:hypothetical protein n=1 Tax=Algoriphagus persicinus TaxID=3108754 RepID=UPI002B3AD819|nr:hypothetical protein [Algoriphagus sp. C2-6-M1]MEB2780868.1 hypothetical protein [Algoriphagus sp. C2-6-M1]